MQWFNASMSVGELAEREGLRTKLDAAIAQLFLSHASDLLVLFDTRGIPVYFSPSVEQYLSGVAGADQRDVLWRMIDPNDRNRVRTRIETLLEQTQPGRARSIHMQFTLNIGYDSRYIEASITRVEHPVDGFLIVARDLTNQRDIEDHLRANEEFFQALLQQVSDGIALVSPYGDLRLFIGLLGQELGYNPGEEQSLNLREIIWPEDYDRLEAISFELATVPNARREVRFRVLAKNGEVRHVKGAVTNLLDNPAVRAFVYNLHDITDTVHALEQVNRLNTELEDRLSHLETVRRVELAVRESHDISLFLGMYAAELCVAIDADALAVHLATGDGAFQTTLGQGFHDPVRLGYTFTPGQQLAGKAASLQEPILVEELGHVDESGVALEANQQAMYRGYLAAPLVYQETVHGVVEFFFLDALPAEPAWLNLAESLFSHGASALAHSQLVTSLEHTNRELIEAYDNTIEGWAYALDLRDEETVGHSKRVTDMTVRLARQLGVPEAEIVHIQRGSLLHDIGKMGVPDSILLKPGRLTSEEYDLMKRHPEYALEMLKPIEFLAPALAIPYSHHERWDGNGYPEGLAGHDIPLSARIFAVVDVYDALTSDRPYRAAWSHQDAIDHICLESGKHFDPEVVQAFVQIFN